MAKLSVKFPSLNYKYAIPKLRKMAKEKQEKSNLHKLTKLENSRRSIMFRDFLLGSDLDCNDNLADSSEQNGLDSCEEKGSKANFKVRRDSTDIGVFVEVNGRKPRKSKSKSKDKETKMIDSRGKREEQNKKTSGVSTWWREKLPDNGCKTIGEKTKTQNEKVERDTQDHSKKLRKTSSKKTTEDLSSNFQEQIKASNSRSHNNKQTLERNVQENDSRTDSKRNYNKSQQQKSRNKDYSFNTSKHTKVNLSSEDRPIKPTEKKPSDPTEIDLEKYVVNENLESVDTSSANQVKETVQDDIIVLLDPNMRKKTKSTITTKQNIRHEKVDTNINKKVHKCVQVRHANTPDDIKSNLKYQRDGFISDPYDGYYCLDNGCILSDNRDRQNNKRHGRSNTIRHVISVNHLVRLDESALSLIERNRRLEHYAKHLTSKWEKDMPVSDNCYRIKNYNEHVFGTENQMEYQFYLCDDMKETRRAASTRTSNLSNIRTEKRMDTTPIMLKNLNALQTDIEDVSHTPANAHQIIKENDTKLHEERQKYQAEERDPKYNLAQTKPKMINQPKKISNKDQHYFSNTSSEETSQYDQKPRKIYVQQEPLTLYRIEAQHKNPRNISSIHKQGKLNEEELMEYSSLQNSLTTEELENENISRTAGVGRNSQSGSKTDSASTYKRPRKLFELSCCDNTMFTWLSNQASMNPQQLHHMTGSLTPRSVSFGEIYFPRRQANYTSATDADDTAKYPLTQFQYIATGDHLDLINLGKQSLSPFQQKPLKTKPKASCHTPSFMLSSPMSSSCTDKVNSGQQDAEQGKSQNVEHLLESVKAIGQQYYTMSSKTMIPAIRQVQNKVICRFYNLRQSLNQGMQTYVNSVEKNARKYVQFYEKNKEEVESSPTYERETFASRNVNQGMQTYVNSVEKNARKYVQFYEKNKEEVESSPTYERETFASRNVNHRNDCAPRNANHRICVSRSTNESRASDGGRYWLGWQSHSTTCPHFNNGYISNPIQKPTTACTGCCCQNNGCDFYKRCACNTYTCYCNTKWK